MKKVYVIKDSFSKKIISVDFNKKLAKEKLKKMRDKRLRLYVIDNESVEDVYFCEIDELVRIKI